MQASGQLAVEEGRKTLRGLVWSLDGRGDANKMVSWNLKCRLESRVINLHVKSRGGVEPQRFVHDVMINEERREETYNVSCEEGKEGEDDANPIT